jgi:peptide/nickel transport system ATP-binding protein
MTDEGKPPVLELRDITKIYKTKRSFFARGAEYVVALNDISLSIAEGEIFGLVGESGSGKTTCGRLIVKLEDPDEGRIYLGGADTIGLKGAALRDYRRQVQMIFQDPYQSLNSQLSIFQSVVEPLTIHRLGNTNERFERVLETLKFVGLSPPEEYIYRYPHQLSGGQRQRVAIARAMVLNPKVVVADEPTSMLDASYSAKIFNILLEVRKNLNVTILFITHSLAAASYLCDRIGVLYRGNLVEIGPADDVIRDPRHPYTQALLDALPKFGQCDDLGPFNTLLAKERDVTSRYACAFFTRCRRAHELKCKLEKPFLRPVGDTRQVACFYEAPAEGDGSDGKACYIGL